MQQNTKLSGVYVFSESNLSIEKLVKMEAPRFLTPPPLTPNNRL